MVGVLLGAFIRVISVMAVLLLCVFIRVISVWRDFY